MAALHTLNLSLRLSASSADAELRAKGEKPSKMQEAARVLQKARETPFPHMSHPVSPMCQKLILLFLKAFMLTKKTCFQSLPKCRTPTFAICPKFNSLPRHSSSQ